MNQLYYGDNLDILRRYVADESVDLVYLDPPFNSNASYNILFAERDGSKAAAQIKAFSDTWRWDAGAAHAYQGLVESGGPVSNAMRAFRTLLGNSDMLAYLAMMAPRLMELRRVLRPSGSIYLHCDPTASHYLKILMDSIFGAKFFLNEIVWKRTSAHSSAHRFGPIHDVILFYGITQGRTWNDNFQPYERPYLEKRFKRGGERPWKDADLTGSGVRNGESGQAWRGFDVTAKGRHWAYPPSVLDQMDAAGRIYWPKKSGGWPRELVPLSEARGVPLQDLWSDISPLNSQSAQRLHYPTQKPPDLLARIIEASSNEGDLVLDPFCGCGTAVEVAHRLRRRWIGIDITHLAISLIKHRMQGRFGESAAGTYEVIGEPVTATDATALAVEDPFQFQYWALGLLGARPADPKKGADRGVDGRLPFFDDQSGIAKEVVISVKSGKLAPAFLRDLRGVIDREAAQIGVLITLQPPTREMRRECASSGFYESPWGKHPRLQVLTVEELLAGVRIDRPPSHADAAYKKPARAVTDAGRQARIPGIA